MLTPWTHQLILTVTVGVAAFNAPPQIASEFGIIAVVVVLCDLGYAYRTHRSERRRKPSASGSVIPV
jgi:hypothetical protein